ncbi:darcynin family protein [Nocardiopsis sp. YSL2]|uniref:darcynin family protein n=1 Tax=Nocardiopsis sp. YSL2 TaxID=2939492 RepID=UPI0026F4694C|nr:darcynin family protein [Nocardiopsis sp. YSL2]
MSEASATETVRYCAVVRLTALAPWLRLTAAERGAVVADKVVPLLAAHPGVRLRWIDVESFTADCSDIVIAECADPRAWNRCFEDLRDTVLFTVPYFRLDGLHVGIEEGHRDAAGEAA